MQESLRNRARLNSNRAIKWWSPAAAPRRLSGEATRSSRGSAPEFVVPLPAGMTLKQAMAVGTAGFTAMQSVMALEQQGVKPRGREVVVTGAAGGVGSVAVAILAHLGYQSGGVDRADGTARLSWRIGRQRDSRSRYAGRAVETLARFLSAGPARSIMSAAKPSPGYCARRPQAAALLPAGLPEAPRSPRLSSLSSCAA